VTGLITFGNSLLDVLGAVIDLRAAGYQTEVLDLQDLVPQDETLS